MCTQSDSLGMAKKCDGSSPQQAAVCGGGGVCVCDRIKEHVMILWYALVHVLQ